MTPELHYSRSAIQIYVFGKSLDPIITEKDPQKQIFQQKEFLEEYFRIPRNQIFFLEQTHGFDCIHITPFDVERNTANFYEKADAMITSLKNVLLCVRTADCMPLFFFSHPDKEKVFAGILHAGWRGIHRGILQNSLRIMMHYIEKTIFEYRVEKKQEHVASYPVTVIPGPYIPGSIYEVGEDVASLFPVIRKKENGKYLLDLWENSLFVLKNMKEFKNLEILDPFGITQDPETNFLRFYSHRRGDTKRNLNVIYIRES